MEQKIPMDTDALTHNLPRDIFRKCFKSEINLVTSSMCSIFHLPIFTHIQFTSDIPVLKTQTWTTFEKKIMKPLSIFFVDTFSFWAFPANSCNLPGKTEGTFLLHLKIISLKWACIWNNECQYISSFIHRNNSVTLELCFWHIKINVLYQPNRWTWNLWLCHFTLHISKSRL